MLLLTAGFMVFAPIYSNAVWRRSVASRALFALAPEWPPEPWRWAATGTIAGMSATPGREQEDVREIVRSLPVEDLREVLLSAVDRHPDVERHVRLAAARATGDLAQLRREVDRGLRTRRFLSYRESSEWAHAARPIVEELRETAARAPSNDLVLMLRRAVGHVVKVILHADDSNGTIGDLARELLDLHAQVCDARVADPLKLAAWMVSFGCEDQDFFEIDPVRYAQALGEPGLTAYRRAIEQHSDRLFAVRWARERLAVLDGDTQAIITLLGEDLTSAHQFIRVCEAMRELGRDDDVLRWARRGLAETDGWQVAKLYDLACGVHERRAAQPEVLALRREQHERMPSSSTYSALRRAAETLALWELERDTARRALRDRDRGGLIDALLADSEPDAAWTAALEEPEWDPGLARRVRLAQAREPTRPDEALNWYLLIADEELLETGRAAYARAVSVLKRARRAAEAAGQDRAFATELATLRERHRRRPTLIAMLDKAALA
jgi:hypothetical protein